MKGMMNLLEKVGLVRSDATDMPAAPQTPAEPPLPPAADAPAVPSAMPAASAAPTRPGGAGVALDQIYADAQVPACAYPAERLLRLLDGLSAMDEGLRRQTIAAIDAADDSWTMADPVRDAVAKLAALEGHASALRAGLAQAEQHTQAQLAQVQQRQEGSLAEIRRQITDLEGLMAREVARGAQECAELEKQLQAQRESVSRQLDTLMRGASAMQSLIRQFPLPG